MATTTVRDHVLSTIASIKTAKSKYELLKKDDKEFEDTFYAAGDELSLIEGALNKAKPNIPWKVPQAVTVSLDSCKITAAKLDTIFDELLNVPVRERQEHYVAYINRKGRSSLVEVLVIEMMECVRQTIKDYANGEDLKEQLTKLQEAIDTLEKMPPSVPMGPPEGARFINNGGEQYNATDKARQFNKTAFHGAVTFN